MCHGVRDVANLSWKFALVSQGKASPALLDIYQSEREPHVRAVIGAAIAAGRYICERDPAVAQKRDATLRVAMGKPAPASASDLIPPIRAGIVSAADQPISRSAGQARALHPAASPVQRPPHAAG
jgi:3-(3-hydroxy-phenyl)propionate hydroxylase